MPGRIDAVSFIGVWDTVGALGVPNVGLPWVNWINRRYQFHDTQLNSRVRYAYQALSIDEARRPFAPRWGYPNPTCPTRGSNRVWFAGVHTDICGGYADGQLADITWHWMTDARVPLVSACPRPHATRPGVGAGPAAQLAHRYLQDRAAYIVRWGGRSRARIPLLDRRCAQR